MNRLKVLVAAALLGLPLAACEEGTKPPPIGEIEGQVVIEGEGMDGISVTLSSGAATTTGSGGYYSFTDVEGGTYTVTISGYPADASFDATSAEVTISSTGQTVTRNFSGSYIRTASLMGMVTVEGVGLPGITVDVSGRDAAQTTTDANGQYTFTGLRAGNYTVEISGFDPTDVAFSDASGAVTIAVGESKVRSFDGVFVRESTIAGRISVEGNGLSGVTVSLQGMGADEEAMTDNGGQYSFDNLRAGEYQVAISGYDTREYGFETTSATIRVEHGKTANQPFEGIMLRTASIMGQVSVEGEGLADVTVSLSGEGENQTTMTDQSGQYTFTDLPAGNFQVGISGYDTDDYSFETTSRNVSLALGATATVPFEGILLRTSGIAGRVSVDGMGLAGVTVTLTGGDLDEAMTAMTDMDGQYAIAGLAAGDYTVAISGYDAVEYSFTDSQDVMLGDDDTEIVNFMGRKLRTAAVMVSVTADGAGLAGVGASLIHITNLATQSGSVIATGVTGTDGTYTFSDLLAGAYGVQIAGADEEIDFPSTLLVTQVATDQTGELTFAGEINRTASIGGMVTVDGSGMAGVMVALSGGDDDVSRSMETGSDGSYSFTALRRGGYTVSITNPDAAMYNFPTTSRSVSVGVGQAQTDQSFAGSQVRTSSISGQVNIEGDALGGVIVTLSGAMAAADTTGDDGLYAFRNLGSGSYTVSFANPDEAAYNFESMSMTFDLGNSDNRTHNFGGTHTRDGSISGTLFIDEGTENNLQDEGEDALAVAGVSVALVGPRLLDRTTAMTDSTGAFTFGDLRQGSYQVMPAAPAEAVDADFMYGGDASYAVDLGVAEDASQNLPYDITHQTVNFSVSLKSGDAMGDALEGAMVTLHADAARNTQIAAQATGADGSASIRFARDGTTGNTVYATVAAPADYYHTSGAAQVVTWDSKDRMASASNDEDIVNTKAEFSFSGATVMTDMGGGKALGGWAISVTSGGDAVEGAPAALGADGSASFSGTAAAGTTYKVSIAGNQDNALDGGESYEGTSVEYTHTGLSLPGTMDAGMMEVTYTSQTLRVYVHHEKDQVFGYTGNILGGDERVSGVVDVDIRYIDGSGRSRSFASSEWGTSSGRYSNSGGAVTFRRVPASRDVIVQARLNSGASNVRLLEHNGHSDELAAYTDADANGIMGGAFGANGGFHHTVELCPLMRTDPTGQRFGECGSFAFVSTHLVYGQVWKHDFVPSSSNDGWVERNLQHVAGTTVTLAPKDGENLAGDGESFRAASSNRPGGLDERKQFNWGRKAAGVYTVTVPAGWVAKVGAPGEAVALGSSLNPLAGDLQIDVTPTTGFVYGRVTDSNGFPVDSVSVSVNGETATTDEFGRYTAAGFGAQTRRISGVWQRNKIFVETNHGGHNNTMEILDFAANSPMEVDVNIAGSTKTATIGGRVTASGTGDPVAGARIWVDYGDGPVNPENAHRTRGLLTGSDGTYSATVVAQAAGSTVAMSASKSDMSFTPARIDVSAIEGSSISGISFTGFAKATITGRVTMGGRPMQGATVVANQVGGTATDTASTGITGTYSLFVPFGNYDVEASKDGYDFSADQRVNVGPGESKSIADFTATETPETPRTPSSDATLSALSLSDGTLDPVFAADEDTYTAEVGNGTASVDVTATANSEYAAGVVIMPEDADTVMAGHQVDLAVGDTDITAMVTSEDSSATMTYTVTVTRAAAVVTLTAAPDPVAEGGMATVTGAVDVAQADSFQVTVTAAGGTLGDNAILSFAAGATAGTGTVTVTAANNDVRNDPALTVAVNGTSSDTTMTVNGDTIAVMDDELVATAPRNLMATPGDQTATVTWTGPSSIGSMPITSYDWELTAPFQAPQSGQVTDLANLTVSLTNLVNGIDYTFSVHAVSSLGDGETATTTVKAQPNLGLAPTTGTIAEAGTDSIEVVLTLSAATREDVTVTLATDSAHLVNIAGATMTIEAGTTADTAHVYAEPNVVDADNTAMVWATADNANDPTDTLTVTITDDDEVPGAPRNFTVTAGDTQLTLEWISPAAAGTSAITHYEYRISAAGAALTATDAWVTATSGVVVTGLTNDSAYAVEIRAVSDAGPGTAAADSGTPTG